MRKHSSRKRSASARGRCPNQAPVCTLCESATPRRRPRSDRPRGAPQAGRVRRASSRPPPTGTPGEVVEQRHHPVVERAGVASQQWRVGNAPHEQVEVGFALGFGFRAFFFACHCRPPICAGLRGEFPSGSPRPVCTSPIRLTFDRRTPFRIAALPRPPPARSRQHLINSSQHC